MFCAYCGTEHDEATQVSSEHVIPYAIGGSNEFTITVCEESNNRLGGQVDRPIIEFFAVRSERFFLGLEGTDGTLPTFDLSGITWIQGREVKLKNIIGPDGKDMRHKDREITRTPNGDTERWDLRGDPQAIRKALAAKIQDQATKGKWVKTDKGKIITLDNLDQILQEATKTIQNPCVMRKIDFDYLWTSRFFAKLALAVGHYLFGEEFSRTRRASELRRTMNSRNLNEAALVGAVIFPETHSLPPQFAILKSKGFHMISVGHGRPRFLLVSLFGWLDAYIALDDVQGAEVGRGIGNMEYFEIALPSRKLSKYSLPQYLRARADRENGMVRMPSAVPRTGGTEN
jgi:hypothetical protein